MRSGKESKLHLKKGEKEGGGGKKIIPTYPASQTYSNPCSVSAVAQANSDFTEKFPHFPLSCYETIIMFITLFLLHFIGH